MRPLLTAINPTMADVAPTPSRRWTSVLTNLTVRELDELQAAVIERRAQVVFEDRKRVRAMVIEAAHTEGFALSELFDLGRKVR